MVRAVIKLIKLVLSITTFVLVAGEKRAKTIESERAIYTERMEAYMDRTVDPCDDFYEYSCGNYFKVHKVKHGVGSTDVFDIVTGEMNDALHDILMESTEVGNTTVSEKAKLFYQSCMRVNIFDYPKSEVYLKLIESLGGWPALNARWNAKHFDWLNTTIALASYGIDAFIEINYSDENLRFEENNFGIHKSMNARPFSRDFNMNKGLIMKILDIYGVSAKDSRKIFRETVELFKAWKKFYDRYLTYDIETMTVDELKEEVPEIDWDRYLFALFGKEVNTSMKVNLSGKKYISKLPTFFTSKNAKSTANYMFLKLLYGLHDEFLNPRYQRDFCIGKVSELMKDVITAMYINSKHHKETIEDEVMSMASYMRSAFKDIIKDNKWMDKETKRRALKKLRDMRMVIGDVELSLDFEMLERDYKDLKIKSDSNFYENKLALLQVYIRKACNRFIDDNSEAEPDKYESDVNAYYSPAQNKMILPAGILRKPFFNPDLPKSYNFGAMGANIIGHEMTHGFDSEGRYYDGDGNQDDWWSSTADKAFEERAECFVNQYSSYHISEMNRNVQGRTTLPENIADSGGVHQGYIAYKKWLKANEGYFDVNKETLPKLNITNLQLFFLAYAQTYCTRYKRGGYQHIEDDVHAVNKFRVIGSVSNFDQFGVEFNCKLGTTMNPEKKCVLW